jgi:hypothetical protein
VNRKKERVQTSPKEEGKGVDESEGRRKGCRLSLNEEGKGVG